MRPKSLAGILLLAFAAVSLAVVALRGGRREGKTGTGAESPERVIVYYFHSNVRCANCGKIQAWSREAVESGFPAAISASRLQWREVNWEARGNEHYQKMYGLAFASVVVAKPGVGGEKNWKRLDELWTLLGNKDEFVKVVQAEVGHALEGR